MLAGQAEDSEENFPDQSKALGRMKAKGMGA
jgi:hypothetical protein